MFITVEFLLGGGGIESVCAPVSLNTVKCRYNAVLGVQEIDRVIAVTTL